MRQLLFLAVLLCARPAPADTALAAVATNFRDAAEALATDFRQATGHEIRLTAAATGKLAAQISSGAPFDLFLSADTETPERLIADGLADGGTRMTYAIGRLVLWTREPGADLSDPAVFLGRARHVAIANPALAPYGKAAMQSIDYLGLSDVTEGKIVRGENIGQAHGMVYSGAADAGFVAASALVSAKDTGGTSWPVPTDAHDPIRQDAVLLAHGRDNAAAVGFLDYLDSSEARAVIEAFGYGTSQ